MSVILISIRDDAISQWPKDDVFDLWRHCLQVNDSMTSPRLVKFLQEVITYKVALKVKVWTNSCFCNHLINRICNSFPFHIYVNLFIICYFCSTNYKRVSWMQYETKTHYRSSIYFYFIFRHGFIGKCTYIRYWCCSYSTSYWIQHSAKDHIRPWQDLPHRKYLWSVSTSTCVYNVSYFREQYDGWSTRSRQGVWSSMMSYNR